MKTPYFVDDPGRAARAPPRLSRLELAHLPRATGRCIKHSEAMAAIVERVLAGLDEDLMEYVVGLTEDTEDDDDLKEAVAAFVLSSELCEDEEAAEAKADELISALGRGQPKVEAWREAR